MDKNKYKNIKDFITEIVFNTIGYSILIENYKGLDHGDSYYNIVNYFYDFESETFDLTVQRAEIVTKFNEWMRRALLEILNMYKIEDRSKINSYNRRLDEHISEIKVNKEVLTTLREIEEELKEELSNSLG